MKESWAASVPLGIPPPSAEESGEGGEKRDGENKISERLASIPFMFTEHLLCAVPDQGIKGEGSGTRAWLELLVSCFSPWLLDSKAIRTVRHCSLALWPHLLKVIL